MFKGLRTAIYQVADINAAKLWYTKALGTPPYFDQPFYVGFNIGGYELGLQPDTPATVPVENVVAYWGVDDCQVALDHLLAIGAGAQVSVQEVGEGIKVATVRDPFGNVFGMIENPHFAEP
jgi:predicted enzyme related to lactoylglutathione lyase